VKPKILLVDDDEAILEQLRWALAFDYNVFTAALAADAIGIYEKEHPPVMTVDLSLNPQDATDLGGMRLLEQILAEDPSTRVIVLTGRNDDFTALRAMQLGAFDYLNKPIRIDELKVIIDRGIHLHRLLHKARQMNQPLGRAVVPSSLSVLKRSDSGLTLKPILTDVNLKSAKKAIEIDFVKKALARHHGVVSRAARDLGISRVNLYELIEKHNIRPREFKTLRTAEKSPLNTGEVS
jgi:DNA-binding NtrC family response regulator